MKRFLFCILLFFSLLLFVGCQEKMIIESNSTVIEPEIFYYEGTEQVSALTVDEDGLLYTATFVKTSTQTSAIGGEEWEEETQHFCVYDLEGNCIKQVDILMGNSSIYAMEIKGNTLYAMASRLGKGQVLYAIDLTTWEVEDATIIAEETEDDFYRIEEILWIDDFLYILGDTSSIKEYILHPEVSEFNDNQILGRISTIEENAQIEILHVDFPQNIFKTKENTLMIYQYNEEYGLGFLEYNPKEETLEEIGWRTTSNAFRNFCLCEDGYLTMKDFVLYYGTLDGVEAQLGTDRSIVLNKSLIYQKGFAFYYDFEENAVERVTVAGNIKENREVHLLINGMDVLGFNGLGYRIIRETVDRDTFSLKVLARDTDFDLYLLWSHDSNAYNLKKNGAFYPLNEIPAVEKYLNACFPYLKEIATNEEGDIWMIPIDLNIPLLLYDKAYAKEKGIDFSLMDYQDLLALTEQAEQESPEQIWNYKIIEEFFNQYFMLEDSFDTQLFRRYAKQLKSLYEVTGENAEAPQSYFSDFIYEYMPFSSRLVNHSNNIEKLELQEEVAVVEVPKMSEELKNVGTCYFFAVNPQSDNIEATLAYLSDLCTYLMTVENSFLLADNTAYTNTSFLQQCYEVYQNGAVYFSIDREVYDTIFTEYLEDKIELEDMIEEVERRLEIYTKE